MKITIENLKKMRKDDLIDFFLDYDEKVHMNIRNKDDLIQSLEDRIQVDEVRELTAILDITNKEKEKLLNALISSIDSINRLTKEM